MLRIWFLALVEPLAQEVEHLPFKQGVPGSSPGRLIRLRNVDCGLSNVKLLSNPQSSISNPQCTCPRRLAWPRTPAFHVGDTGSNPVGDTSLIRTDQKFLSLALSSLWKLIPGGAGLSCKSNAVVLTAFCSSPVSRVRLSVKVSAMRKFILSH